MIKPVTGLILIGLVVITAICSFITVQVLKQPKSVMEQKLAEAQRVHYYRMDRERGPSIRLSGTEDALRLVTHVLLPRGTVYDPARRIHYGIKLRVTSGRRVVWQHSIYTITRQSKDELQDGLWRYENSFTREADVQVTDDRVFLVHLPRNIPTDALLTTTLLGEQAHEGLVRFYRQSSRSELEREVAASSLPPSKQRARAWSNTYEPWSMMPADEQESRVRFRTDRLSAVGERDLDYQTRSVYYTGFRLPADISEVEEAIKLHAHRGAALNIVGPTEIAIRTELADPAGAPPEDGEVAPEITLEVASVDAAGAVPLRPSALILGETTTLSIPEGLHSVRMTTRSPRLVALWVTGMREALFGAPPEVAGDVGQLQPDEIRVPMLLSGMSDRDQPVRVAALGAPDPLQRLVRIDVRFLDPSAPALPERRDNAQGHDDHAPIAGAAPFAGTLTIRFYDRDGVQVRSIEEPLRSVRAPFEWLDVTGFQPREVSEPASVRLIAPQGIASIELETSVPAALRLFRYLPGEELFEQPYREAKLERDVQWRYARIEKRVWWPMRAVNYEELHERKQVAMLVAHARLEPRRHDDDDGGNQRGGDVARREADAVVVEPLDAPERHGIIEPLPAERVAEARAGWGPGLVAALPVGRAGSFDVAAAADVAHRQARMHFFVGDADLGKTATIRVDGAVVREERLLAGQGYWELPPLAAGAHTIEVTSAASSLELYVDRPPSDAGAALYRLRTVFLMDRVPLRLRITRPMRKRTTLHAVIYAPWNEARPELEIRSVVSGGRPGRVEGEVLPHITRAVRQVPLPEARHDQVARFTDRKSGSAGYPRVVIVPLGEDLVAGTHFVEIYSVTGRPLWVRFYVTDIDPGPPEERALQWNAADAQ